MRDDERYVRSDKEKSNNDPIPPNTQVSSCDFEVVVKYDSHVRTVHTASYVIFRVVGDKLLVKNRIAKKLLG